MRNQIASNMGGLVRGNWPDEFTMRTACHSDNRPSGTLMPSNSPETHPDVGIRINPVVAADWDEPLRRKLTH
jgi:hypothetical protein